MKIIDQSYLIMTTESELWDLTKKIEIAGRTCYKSEYKITKTSSENFCRMLIKKGHFPMLDHCSITVRFITDRGVTHELVRHRHAAYAQESTRYVNYRKMNIEFIRPVFEWGNNSIDDRYMKWSSLMEFSEICYIEMIDLGCSPQEARSVLPNSLKTEIVVTADITEWRHIFKLRTSKVAHPQIRELMIPLLEDFQFKVPALFEDIEIEL